MILYNAKIYNNGVLREGAILIENEIIKSINFDVSDQQMEYLRSENDDGKEIDCKNKIILPGIIDIHAHLRDLNQSYKETFSTGTKAAAISGITTIFDMPNTDPPANTFETVKHWMDKAKQNIHVDVGFISGVPNRLNEDEIKKIVDLGVIGFKIYPHDPLTDLDWKISGNFRLLLNVSSRYQIPIFIHPEWPLSNEEKEEIFEDYIFRKSNLLKIHDELNPCKSETHFVKLAIENYQDFIKINHLEQKEYPIIHFCHISCKESYSLINLTLKEDSHLHISYEITPHHLLLSNDIVLNTPAIAKVLPPLRDKTHPDFLFKEFISGNLMLIGTDHAPHSLDEKSREFFDAPSGFPGLETYPLVILDKVNKFQVSLENFIKVACEGPANIFNLKGKGYIREGYDADLLIVDKISEYQINPKKFKSKAKISPFENYTTNLQIWKVFLRGKEIKQNRKPFGKIIKREKL